MTNKSMSLSELLHVCHLPACTAITMNPFLHQLNNHRDQHSNEIMQWLSRESAKRERVIFNYRNRQDQCHSSPHATTSPPKLSSPATKATTKFGSLHTAGKHKKFSLLPSVKKSRKGNRGSSTSSFTPEMNHVSAFIGIPELSDAVQLTGAHLNEACGGESHPRSYSSGGNISTGTSPFHVSAGKENDSVKDKNSFLPQKKKRDSPNNHKFSDVETCIPVEKKSRTDKAQPHDNSKSISLSKIEQQTCRKLKFSNKNKNRNKKANTTKKNSRRKSTSNLQKKKSPMKPKACKSSSSLVDQDMRLTPMLLERYSNSSLCEVKKEILRESDSDREGNPKVISSPSLAFKEDKNEIEVVSVITGKANMKPKVKVEGLDRNLENNVTVSSDAVSTNAEATRLYGTNMPIKREKDVPSKSNRDRSRERSAVSPFSGEQSNTTMVSSIKREANHQDIDLSNRKGEQRNNSVSSSVEKFDNGNSPSTWSIVIEEDLPLYSLEHLSYNFVLCDYVRESLAFCSEQSGILTKTSALSVQQVIIVLLFLRGARLEFLRDMCVCCVMRPITPTSQGTVVLKPVSSSHAALELSLKEFQYVKDFVRFVRPGLADSMYGCVFVMDGGAPFELEPLRQAIATCWNRADVNVGLKEMLKSVALSCGRR